MKQLAAIAAAILLAGCSVDRLNVTSEVINADYIGNGAEWDPYDEASSWGCEISEADWAKIFHRLDFMRMGFVRCMINSPYTYYDNGKYDRERHSCNILKLLQYCQDKGIHVIYGEFNPPAWDMKGDQEWIDMSVDYLNWLVTDKGFDCIKEFVIFNEPDGNWASTNGDYAFWKTMAERFHAKMASYPGLLDKVALAAPDAVVGYHNPASPFDCKGWVENAVADVSDIAGLFEVHAYPGQNAVRSGKFTESLRELRELVPADRKIVLGEAGYKYFSDPADSLLAQEYWRRAETCPFTKGSDCNMLADEFFYGLDLALLGMEVMNNGYSAVAIWMLDDAMHSSGDSGKTEDVKIWGLWNSLGEEVFGDASLEEVKPAYYAWSLMCRYFPNGCDIVRTEGGEGIRSSACVKDGKTTVAMLNLGDADKTMELVLPSSLENGALYLYEEDHLKWDGNGWPEPVKTGLNGRKMSVTVPAGSFALVTDME